MNNDGVPVYLVDPGINGVYDKRPGRLERAEIHRAESHARLLHHQRNPGRTIAVGSGVVRRFHRRLCLSFPAFLRSRSPSGFIFRISTSAPVYVGGMVRWLVDRYTRRKHAGTQLTEDQLVAEGDKSNGVLFSSGYIAGGTLAGVAFRFLDIPMKDRLDAFEKWAAAHNPFFEGPSSDMLALIPFAWSLRFALSRRPRRRCSPRAKRKVR